MTDCSQPARPANTFQIRRAQALCAHFPALKADLEAFICTAPSYAQMDAYLKQLKANVATDAAAKFVGVAMPLPGSQLEHMKKQQVAAVHVQPSVTLERWRVRETSSGLRYFVGYCVENNEYRVSSAVQVFDRSTAVGVTASGRRYLLSGSPCFDGEARRVWQELAERHGIGETKDVSIEFMSLPTP